MVPEFRCIWHWQQQPTFTSTSSNLKKKQVTFVDQCISETITGITLGVLYVVEHYIIIKWGSLILANTWVTLSVRFKQIVEHEAKFNQFYLKMRQQTKTYVKLLNKNDSKFGSLYTSSLKYVL